jgi:hypothetical protein
MSRLAKQHSIVFAKYSFPASEIPEDIASEICNLFENTNTSLWDIVHTYHLKYDRVRDFLIKKYSQEVFDKRKTRLYSISKTGEKNPMLGICGDEHPKYKGLVEDGNGYYMCLKPDWYTGRKGSKHVFYHSVVMCEYLGITEIPKGFVIHHIDGDKKNNEITNLALLTNAAHIKLHKIQRHLGVSKAQRLDDNIVGVKPETPDND